MLDDITLGFNDRLLPISKGTETETERGRGSA